MCLYAQSPEPVNGVRDPGGNVYALRDVIIHPQAGQAFAGTLVIKDKKILAVSADADLPAGALVMSLPGRHVYPGFIEIWADAGFEEPARKGRADMMERNNEGVGDWNMAVHPEFDGSLHMQNSEAAFRSWRESGFTTICSHLDDGIMQGSGPVVNTAKGSLNEITLRNRAATFYSFNKGSSPMDYPSSLMGSIALFRQTFKNLSWYEAGGRDEYTSRSLEALLETSKLPAFFKASSWRDVLRISELSSEIGKPFYILECGDSYLRASEIKKAGASLLLTLNYPEAWNVSDASAVEHISWDEMQHWEAAPANAALLREAGIPIAFSSSGLKAPSQFVSALSKAVKAGMPAQEAFRAVTEVPARWLGIWEETGSLAAGKFANVLVCSDTLFSDQWSIESCFVQGQFFQVKSPVTFDLPGKYECSLNGKIYAASIKNEVGKFTIELSDTGKAIQISPEISGTRLDFTIREKGPFYLYRFNGNTSAVNGQMQISGFAYTPDGETMPFTFSKTGTLTKENKKEPEPSIFTAKDFSNRYPFHAFGNDSLPRSETILFQGATVWTCAENSLPFKGDILVSNGKIIACAEKVNPVDYKIKETVRIVSAEGKHISPGIIDEHSHIAIERGVNEGSQNNTAEVRIGDAVTSEDPAVYYQLMGGVTSAQLLHGSANPIGGQSAIIKLRWGETPSGMINRDAPGHIKFALGENVKQSNWGDNKTSRFPQTRMGVEQVFYDAFERARAYMLAKEEEKKRKGKNIAPLREDLELEAIQEIIEGKRFITCHSYVQSEVNMLMHVADSMGFKVNTFTHILEGYKVADKLAAHGANASTFSDWWAYKFEVNDAISYNAALLTRAGVLTGINSDDAEMGRRLNQEAAKAVLYGGLSETEALKLVTINPAKMLHIDKTTGSIEAGKDADLVIWSAHPLSVRARAELTMIDGKVYFDLSEHDARVLEIADMRAALIAKLLGEKPVEGKNIIRKKRHQYHCEDLYHGELYEEEEL